MRYSFNVFADYFQFYLEDEGKYETIDPREIWNEQALADMFSIQPGLLAIATVRNTTVPVTLEIYDAPIDQAFPEEDFDQWDHVIECSTEILSGRLVILGNEYYPHAPRVPITPGIYQVRVYFRGLNTLSENGLQGRDEYHVVFARGPSKEPRVLKRGKV